MCILCVIQKWSRRVATMLPWLVIPLIGLWAVSQFLPPPFRFEITSPKIACVFVLLITLFWYEILMPRLSAWRVRRNALLREKKRTEALELQKLKKTATRRCRNCFTPYRDQNPGGGKFMCTYCGHVSKRPVLDLTPGIEASDSGFIRNLVGKGGKMLNGRAWSENGWFCNQDWFESGNWSIGSNSGKLSCSKRDGIGLYGGGDNCMAENSYPGLTFFPCTLLKSFLSSLRWIWRKIFRISSSKEVNSCNTEHRGVLGKSGEHGASFHESRGEKARRKAEEKRQARIEKELEEEEERKQKEEVARLIEERRKLRDEKMKAEVFRNKLCRPVSEKEARKEAERKRQDSKRDKERVSNKCNSDAEELDKTSGKESDRKRDLEKNSEPERQEHSKSKAEFGKSIEPGHVMKNNSTNFSRSNTGSRYFDRMRGTFLSSSRALGGSGLFGRSVNSSPVVLKENKLSSVDHSSFRKGLCSSERTCNRMVGSGLDKSGSLSVSLLEAQPVAPKKSWQQLFTRSTSASETSNIICRPNSNLLSDTSSPQHTSSGSPFDNPINFGLPSPFIVPPNSNISAHSSLGFTKYVEPKFAQAETGCEIVPEEPEQFEDPSYVADPMSLLGPVSESLENFQKDCETEISSTGINRKSVLKSVSMTTEVMNKPSPIETPSTRLRVVDEAHKFTLFPATFSPNEVLISEDANTDQSRTWQMWNSFPLGQDGLGFVNASGNWCFPQEWKSPTKDGCKVPSSKKTMASLFSNDDQVSYGSQSPQMAHAISDASGEAFSPFASAPPVEGPDSRLPFNNHSERSPSEVMYGSTGPSGASINYSCFDSSAVSHWPM